jgi:hypothetical protein
MPDLSSLEGALHLRLAVAKGAVRKVSLRSDRPLRACALLIGRPVEQALEIIPLMFSLCRAAQSCAGLEACEEALGVTVSPAQRAARELLVLAEAVDENCRRIVIDWPRLGGETPVIEDLAAVRAALKSVRPAFYPGGDRKPGGDWLRLGGGRLKSGRPALGRAIRLLEERLNWAVLGGKRMNGSPFGDPSSFYDWCRARRTPAARSLARILEHGLPGFGRSDVRPMPDLGRDWLHARLKADSDGEFSSRPNRDGEVFETGPLARLGGHPLIAGLVRTHGNGLLPRMAARMIELLDTPVRMRALGGRLADEPGSGVERKGSGSGLAIVECARGRLIHRVEIEDGIVTGYRIVAPTEWNFHPRGPLVRGLVTAQVDDEGSLEGTVSMLVTALDPCVPCRLEIGRD